jgi:ABC-type transporter Mla subunit MlaD
MTALNDTIENAAAIEQQLEHAMQQFADLLAVSTDGDDFIVDDDGLINELAEHLGNALGCTTALLRELRSQATSESRATD